ncbi:MAG: hypothetical protein L6Q52_07975 [Rhodocyclaceae bacterium]|nr:hypothetical protein [Rhodocyclaceae bacterium]
MALNSFSSLRPAFCITGLAAKKAPWKAMPCILSCRSAEPASSRAIWKASR